MIPEKCFRQEPDRITQLREAVIHRGVVSTDDQGASDHNAIVVKDRYDRMDSFIDSLPDGMELTYYTSGVHFTEADDDEYYGIDVPEDAVVFFVNFIES